MNRSPSDRQSGKEETSGSKDSTGEAPPKRRRAGERLAELEEVELEIERLVAGGVGLGRFEGIPIFVARSAPGDHLRVRLVERRPDYGRAEIAEILQPGPGRREAPCPHFDACGGCDLQHIDDELQADLKAGAVSETLARLGGIDTEGLVEVVAGDAWGYRLRMQLHVESGEPVPRVGYHARGSHDLVPVTKCPVLVPELDSLLSELPRALGPDRLDGRPPVRVDVAAGGGAADSAAGLTTAPKLPGLPHGEVRMAVGDIEIGFDARCFFQAHRGLLPTLVDRVVGSATGETAIDLYAGVGLFTLPLARRYERVTAVEGDRIAARYARKNARSNGLGTIDVKSLAVESWIARLPEGVDRVVVDPPRAGLSRAVRRELERKRPRRLTYVSCHEGALARDLRELKEIYRIEAITVLDLFPQTGHTEVIAQLVIA